MPEPSRSASDVRIRNATVAISQLAERQCGVVSRRQLKGFGLGDATLTRWLKAGRLHRVHPGVYAVGHRALSEKGRLAAALLYAGPGAALSHETGAWWLALTKDRPTQLAVSVPRRRRSLRGLRIHHPRHLDRIWHRGLPVTSPARTLLDLAACARRAELRRALAEAFYLRLVTVASVEAVLIRGHPGSGALREALAAHTPQLARTRSVLEERFLELCERYAIPAPEMNVRIEGLMVDAVWRRQRVIVELDGQQAHGDVVAIDRDRARELTLRAAGWLVHRYSWRQITQEGESVAGDLHSVLSMQLEDHGRSRMGTVEARRRWR
jgi:predicted transcriptional regulator of viral defense system